MLNHHTPENLADYVFKELQRSKIKDTKPSIGVLKDLFYTLYYVSLQTEEGQFIKVTVTLIDPTTTPLPEDEVEPYDSWKFYPFKAPLEFTIKNLVKLSKAADPWSSSLAVYYDKNENLFINGMIDQSIHYQSFLNYEREEKPSHPGIIQTMITGIGVLNVMLDFQLIATLNQNQLIRLYPNVFEIGPVSEFLRKNAKYTKRSLETLFGDILDSEETEAYNDVIFSYVVQSISRILLKIKNYHHGGAILITKDLEGDFEIKYPLKYNRVSSAIQHILASIAENEYLADEIKKLKRKGKDMPIKLHLDSDATELDIEDSLNELIGAIRFVSSLSCVDGVVILSPQLDVQGFGSVITRKSLPDFVYLNKASKVSKTPIKIAPSHFGTRHQSMFAYCFKHPESIGFVISQDGEIRAIKCIDGRVMMWENIKVYQFQKSSKLPRILFLPKM